jgi:hypothetical protein
MMSYAVSLAWGRHVLSHYHQSEVWWCPVLSHCHVTNGQWYDTVLSGRLTTVVEYMSGQHDQCCTMSYYPHVLQTLMVSSIRTSYNVCQTRVPCNT